VPVLGAVPAGDLSEAIQDPQGWLPVPGNIGGEKAFALRPAGDSMNELVEEGGYIVVDPDDLDLVPGRAYVVTTADGRSTFKRFRADPPRLEPESSNPDHQPILIGREPFVIAGRVIYAAHEL
jgi:repressor LexA